LVNARLFPTVELDLVWPGRAFAGFEQRFQAQQEDRPFGAAVVHKFHRFLPALVLEENALTAEVESTAQVLNTPAARLIAPGEERPLLLEEVEALLASDALVVDACRHVVRDADTTVSLTTRPVLFAVVRAAKNVVIRSPLRRPNLGALVLRGCVTDFYRRARREGS
jgi:hypothetical protein